MDSSNEIKMVKNSKIYNLYHQTKHLGDQVKEFGKYDKHVNKENYINQISIQEILLLLFVMFIIAYLLKKK